MEKLTKDQEIEYWKAKAEAYQSRYCHLQKVNHALQKDVDRYFVLRNVDDSVVYIDDQPYWGPHLDAKCDEVFQYIEPFKDEDGLYV